MKVCCFSGHRDLSYEKFVKARHLLYESIEQLISKGYKHFISGFANGIDIMAAGIVCELKERYPDITIEAMIPYAAQLDKKDSYFQSLLKSCDDIIVCSRYYFSGCMIKRDNMMLKKSDMLLAVYDGRLNGGTYYTINKAKKDKLDILILEV